jgi:hypothetical protein
MNTVYIHIDETLDAGRLGDLRRELLQVPHVRHVEINARLPHDMLVEFEPHHNVPMTILHRLNRRGLHSDIMSG